MPTLIQTYNWGSALRNQNPDLTRQLDTAYTQTAQAVNTKTGKFITDQDPPNAVTASDFNKNLSVGDFWINSTSDNAWIMTSRTTDVLATWKQIT